MINTTYHNDTAYHDYVERLRKQYETPEDHPADAPKFDAGKLPWHLFPFDAAEEIVRVYAFGAGKYSAHGWREGFHWSRIFAAVCRHLFAWWRGEDRDAESGLLHMAHAGWGVLCLLDMSSRGRGVDNRWTSKPSPGPHRGGEE